MKIWQRWKQTALHNKALVLSSVLMAFGTVFYSGAAIVQIWMFERSSKQASDQADKLIAAANKIQAAAGRFSDSADGINRGVGNSVKELEAQAKATEATRESSQAASQSALQFSIDSSRLDQRAWIGIGGIDPGDFSKDKGFPITITVVNSGKTPAQSVTFSSRFFTSAVPNSGPSNEEIRKLVQFPQHDIAPQGKLVEQIGDINFPAISESADQINGDNFLKAHFNTVNEDQESLYFFGTIEYKDVFGNPHKTDYCLFIAEPKMRTIGACSAFNNIE